MKRGAPNHPKVWELARMLRISHPTAVGHLELLWHFTAQYAPRGDIGRYPNQRIADAVGWRRKPEVFIDALLAVGLLDATEGSGPVVHHWADHAEDSVRKRLARNGQNFVALESLGLRENVQSVTEDFQSVTGKSPVSDGKKSVSVTPAIAIAIAKPLRSHPPLPSVGTDSGAQGGSAKASPKASRGKQREGSGELEEMEGLEDFEGWAERIYALWEKRKDKVLALQQLTELWGKSGFVLAKFEATFGDWVKYWGLTGWRFAPSLANWLADDSWRYPPPSEDCTTGRESGKASILQAEQDAERSRKEWDPSYLTVAEEEKLLASGLTLEQIYARHKST